MRPETTFEKPLRLALIGMSGAGKTFWTKKLAEQGIPAVFCDEREEHASLVLDTTGSVIYTGNHLLMRLRRQMTVVYLAATAEEQQLLIERYLNDPKPVLWRGAFQTKSGETARQTVARCYPALIEARRRSYEALAHCTLQVGELRTAVGAEQFLERIRKQLR